MSQIDYNEILLEAIDTVVTTRLSDVNFDKTVICTIVDASKAAEGEYTVFDGAVEFIAYNQSETYKKD
jgi:hypothetical protein